VVQVGSLGFTGTVVTPPDEQHRVEVRVGNARVRLDLAQVRKVGEAPPVQPARYDSIQLNPDWPIMSPEPELDLRGHSVNDSLEQVDAFLDQALAQGRQRARIIHGKGTGALRQGIWKHLAHHSAVESFDYAAPEQGGEGATIIELA
jgi:DNA mismatch repair protein MutS2